MRNKDKTSFDYTWPSRVVATLVVCFPYSIHKVDFRGAITKGLNVTAYKSSPAYAAFEDLRESYPALADMSSNDELLSSGQSFLPSPPPTKIRTLALKGLTIRSNTHRSPQPIQVAGDTKYPPNIRSEEDLLTKIQDKNGQLLPLTERKRLLTQNIQNAEDWSILRPAEKAQQLVEESLQQAPVISYQSVLPSQTGTPIYIAKTEPRVPNSSKTPKPAANDNTRSFISNVREVQPPEENQRPLTLEGQVEMTGGLAFVGPQTQVTVRRVHKGRDLERGNIWVAEGRFEIQVKEAIGSLIAELKTREGRVLGRGELNLVNIKEAPRKDSRIADLRIPLRPTTEGAAFRAISGYSHGHQIMPVQQASVEIQAYSDPQRVSEEGVVSEPTLYRRSSFVARAVAQKHWPSIMVGQASRPQDVRLFSNSMVQALINLQLSDTERQVAEQVAIVWGQVRRDGAPRAGVQIEMAGNYQPIYFDENYIPNSKLTQTSSNGLFAFLKVRAGVQAVRVIADQKVYPAQVFPTENKHISYVELDIEDDVTTRFKIVDVMEHMTEVPARIRLVGTDDIVSLEGAGHVRYSLATNSYLVEAEAGADYEVSRMTVVGRPTDVVLPMVRRDWLTKIYYDQNITSIPGRGTIVGFVDHHHFEVEMTGYGKHDRMQIVYFDSKGNVLNTRTGVAGGGFVIFNAPQGLQTVFIHPSQARESYSQVLVAEPEYVHIVAWSPGGKR